ncbi:hypothetical protein FLW53_23380 [Microbispora sp. SCL1-1]|uniref:hypothetical protein n=1 Tax=unclassified Microbispora TaxID=2614687 RepID=UPI00115808CF|nr:MULTISPECIES: hypothetical protein [unclassified Microbispora]NJP27087.1 hypothetical protein [Microbispora sp. CL1-1]TQS11433.1 hypothetical protein FLW53_23380 [Microbispora sp. SCL1-1]
MITIATEARIVDAYTRLAAETGRSWVSLTAIRRALADLPRDEQDRALRELARCTDVRIVPWENQKTLTTEDQDAALWYGDQWKHCISISLW